MTYQHLGCWGREWLGGPVPGSFVLLSRNSCSFSFTSVLAMAPGGARLGWGDGTRSPSPREPPAAPGPLQPPAPLTLAASVLAAQRVQLLQALLLLQLLPLPLPLLLQLLLPARGQRLLLLLRDPRAPAPPCTRQHAPSRPRTPKGSITPTTDTPRLQRPVPPWWPQRCGQEMPP